METGFGAHNAQWMICPARLAPERIQSKSPSSGASLVAGRTSRGHGQIATLDWLRTLLGLGHALTPLSDNPQLRTGHGQNCGTVANADSARTRTKCGRGLDVAADGVPDIRGNRLGRYLVIARQMPGQIARNYVDNSSDTTPDIRPDAARILCDLRPYVHVRGWCLTKMTGFHVSESRQSTRSAERIKMDSWAH
jgi:hypothetical protein